MATQLGMQAYMDRHRIRALFEELMNKVLRDMPDEPLVYLLRTVYKKAGMEIPQGIRYGGLRKSTSDLQKSISPERKSRPTVVSASADMAATRLKTTSPTRVTKVKDVTRGSKQKPEWSSDNKITSSFDELWEDSAAGKREKTITRSSVVRKSNTKQPATSANAWASVGLGEDGEEYTSPTRHGQGQKQEASKFSEKELLALESVPLSRRAEPSSVLPSSSVTLHGRGSKSKIEALKHKQELGQLLSAADHKLTDSGIGLDQLKDDDDNDAIELLENGDDLRREGVKNIPKSGFKLSRNLRHRENEPPMKLSINTYVYPSEKAERYDTPGTEMFSSEPSLNMIQQTNKDLDEEEDFESVSQVSGPRHPVWAVSDSEIATGDAIPLRPSYSTTVPQKSNVRHRSYTEKSLHATAPPRLADQSVDSADDLAVTATTWPARGKHVSVDNENIEHPPLRSAHSASSVSGWRLPDDTDAVSGYDWDQSLKGAPRRDPRDDLLYDLPSL